MKRMLAVLLCVVLPLSLLCSCNDSNNESSSIVEEVEAFDISKVSISDLPTEMLAEDLSTWSTINLIAELPDENVGLYGLAVNEDGTGVIFRKGDNLYYYDWVWFTTQNKMPEIASMDIDGDNEDEIAISMYVDYNTNVSVEELHVIDFESGKVTDICFTTDQIRRTFEDKFDIRYETDEAKEESTKNDKSDKDDVSSKTWLIDHTSEVGKRIIFEQKAEEVSEGKDPKKYFTYDATRIVRDNGTYDGITAFDNNVDYTFSKGTVTMKMRVAAKFVDSEEITFICTVSTPVTIEDGKFVMGKLKFNKI